MELLKIHIFNRLRSLLHLIAPSLLLPLQCYWARLRPFRSWTKRRLRGHMAVANSPAGSLLVKSRAWPPPRREWKNFLPVTAQCYRPSRRQETVVRPSKTLFHQKCARAECGYETAMFSDRTIYVFGL